MRPLSRTMALPSVLVLVLILAGCGEGASGTPGAAPSGAPSEAPSDGSAAPSPSPSVPEPESPSATPSPSAPTDPTTAIGVDSVVRTTVAGLRLREDPTTAADSLGTLASGAPSYVVDGPVTADGYRWYLLAGLGLPHNSGCAGPLVTDPWECPGWFGWAAAGSPEGDAWLVEHDLECPNWPEVVTTDLVLGVQRIAYLACFGDEERTLTGYYPPIPDDAGLGGACAEVPEPLSWIGCNLGYEHLNTDEAEPFGAGFVVSVDPDAVTMPERGQWVQLTGRFDHPAATDCTFGESPAQSALYCRAQFVVESAEAVPAP